MRTERGFTIVEMVLGSAIFLVLFGAATIALIGDQRAERVLTAQIGPEMRARDAMERLATELRMAGLRGEDRNDNGDLDDGEDVNANGRLDADWSLEDGATDRPELTFNRRIDFESPEEGACASGVYSSPVRYLLENESLVRYWTRTDPETGEATELRHIVATGITGLRFTREGTLVTVAMDLKLPPRVYKTGKRTIQTSIWLRN
ncbi:MAG: prepilin-type N-terminal cleavage/methylation domain-containing protein [Planctomycetes bacterium]|nr:prepilin-type N-terminal cleavage/methylation domain-containing protein [Planctomycetota bacterium]